MTHPNAQGVIKYDHGQIQSIAGTLTKAAGDLGTDLEDLNSFLSRLDGTWEGESRQQYLRYQDQWNRSAAELQSMLRRLADAAGRGNDEMAEADRRAAAGWNA